MHWIKLRKLVYATQEAIYQLTELGFYEDITNSCKLERVKSVKPQKQRYCTDLPSMQYRCFYTAMQVPLKSLPVPLNRKHNFQPRGPYFLRSSNGSSLTLCLPPPTYNVFR